MADQVSDERPAEGTENAVSGSKSAASGLGDILAPLIELEEAAPIDRLREWCFRRPRLCVFVGAVMLVAGGLIFLAATGRRSVGLAILFALIAAVVGAVGLLLLNEPISRYVKIDLKRGRRAGIVGFFAGLAVVGIAVAVQSPIVAVVGAVIVLLALLAINAWLLAGSQKNNALLLVLGLVLSLIAPILVWVGDGVDMWSILAIIPWVLGLVLFKVGLPPWIDAQRIDRRWMVTIDALLAVAFGAALLYWAARAFNEPALLFGLALPVIGLSALGISLARFDLSGWQAYIPLIVGTAAVLFGAVLTQRIVGLVIVTLVAALVVAAVGAWFVFRGEALIAVLLLGFIVGWVLVDRVSSEDADPFPAADLTFLAVGDSFISGEGAPRFFDGTNVVGPDGNQCRRAPTAYPYLVADRLEAGLVFLACSGAKTTDMDDQGEPPDPFPEVAGGEDQLQRLQAVEGIRVDDLDAVFVSIGGNDVGFGTIIQACLLPQSCAVDDRTQSWLRNVAETKPQLVSTYLTIKEIVGDDVPVIAMPYPIIVRPNDECSLAIDGDEIAFVAEFTAALNETVATAAAEAGINFFQGSIDAFDDRLLCDEDPATNFFHLGPTNGPIADTLLPTNWVHGSLHPRASGHGLIADLLASEPAEGSPSQGYVVDLLASVADGGEANPTPTETQPPDEDQPQYEELPDEEWIQERLYETAADLVPPIGLLLSGGLIAAFGLIRTGILTFLDPSNNRPRRREAS